MTAQKKANSKPTANSNPTTDSKKTNSNQTSNSNRTSNTNAISTANKVFDVIVVGAGAVGLLFAEALAESFDVALVEKRKHIGTDKSWWVPKAWLRKENLQKYITNYIEKIGLFCQETDVVKKLPNESICACIDENRYFADYAAQFRDKGGKLFTGTQIVHFSNDEVANDGIVRLFDDKGKLYKARMVLDCSGVDSIFVTRERNIKHCFYWNVYGRLFKDVNDLGSTSYIIRCYQSETENTEWKGHKVFINDVPEGDGQYTPWLHFISPRRASIPEMRAMYKELLRRPYIKSKLSGAKVGKEKYGWIPAQDFKYRAKNRILSLGDAGGMAPFQNGMSFSLAVYKKRKFVDKLNIALQEDILDRSTLTDIVKLTDKEELNFDFGKLVFSGIMNSDINEFVEIIELFNQWGIDRISKFLFLLDEDSKNIYLLIMEGIKKFGISRFKEILGRDGFGDELNILREMGYDSIRNII